MKAVVYKEYGGSEVVEITERPKPEIAANEVLIKVAATSLNPGDINVREGMLMGMFRLSFPFIPGVDVSGTVESVGSDVTHLKVGDKVYAYNPLNRPGAAAEYVAINAAIVAKAPESLPLADAAALPVAACTAWAALFNYGGLTAGQRVLIIGASGGVGTLAVQLAKQKGATVVAVASAKREALLRDLGADEVIDYTTQPLTEGVTAPVNVIVDLTPSNGPLAAGMMPLVSPGGIYVAVAAPPPGGVMRSAGVRFAFAASSPSAEILTKVAEMVDAGQLRPIITERFPLDEYKSAQGKIGTTAGKVLIEVGQ